MWVLVWLGAKEMELEQVLLEEVLQAGLL